MIDDDEFIAQCQTALPSDVSGTARRLFELLDVERRASGPRTPMILRALCEISSWSNLTDAERVACGLSWEAMKLFAAELLAIDPDDVAMGYALIASDHLGDTAAVEEYRRQLNYDYPPITVLVKSAFRKRHLDGLPLTPEEEETLDAFNRDLIARAGEPRKH